MPAPAEATRTLQAVGARVADARPWDVRSTVTALRALAAESPLLVALFDARSIAGERHLLSAWAHLGRSRQHGEPRLRDRGAELALYVAGEDQLGRALAKVGVSAETREVVLLFERPREAEPLLARFGLVADPLVYPRPPSEETLDRLGLSATEREAVPRSAWEGLVLERVALVDLSGSSGASVAPRRGGEARRPRPPTKPP